MPYAGWRDDLERAQQDPRYVVLKIEKVTTKHEVSFAPDWAHISSWDVFVGQMEDARDCPTVKGGEPNMHRSAWAPYVLLGSEDSLPRMGFNPRAARYLAQKLLEAADLCERKEFEMGWHPSQEKRQSNPNPAGPGAPPDDGKAPHRLTALERVSGEVEDV